MKKVMSTVLVFLMFGLSQVHAETFCRLKNEFGKICTLEVHKESGKNDGVWCEDGTPGSWEFKDPKYNNNGEIVGGKYLIKIGNLEFIRSLDQCNRSVAE